MGINRICPHCGGPQKRSGKEKKYARFICRECKRVEYVPTEEREVFKWEDLPRLLVGGVLKIWWQGKIHDVRP